MNINMKNDAETLRKVWDELKPETTEVFAIHATREAADGILGRIEDVEVRRRVDETKRLYNQIKEQSKEATSIVNDCRADFEFPDVLEPLRTYYKISASIAELGLEGIGYLESAQRFMKLNRLVDAERAFRKYTSYGNRMERLKRKRREGVEGIGSRIDDILIELEKF